MANRFQSVTKVEPCPCCGKGDWCTRAIDIDPGRSPGNSKLVEAGKCMRSNEAPDGYVMKKEMTSDGGRVYLRFDTGAGKPYRKPSIDFNLAPLPRPSMSVVDRDKDYRYLAEQFGKISFLATKDLSNRGLTEKEIKFMAEQKWISNWEAKECLPLVSKSLPGIDPQSGKTTGSSGLAIAAMSVGGKIQGYQVYPKQVMYLRQNGQPLVRVLNDGAEEKIHKYKWLSSSAGNSVKVDGELPLACWKHPTKEPKVAVYCEGFLKSAIAAVKIWREGYKDVVVIGAASGFYQEKILNRTLEQLSSIERHILAPDAGSHENESVMGNYLDLAEKMEKLGHQLEIAWFGGEKSFDKHIDELSSLDYQELLEDISHCRSRAPVSVPVIQKNNQATKDLSPGIS